MDIKRQFNRIGPNYVEGRRRFYSRNTHPEIEFIIKSLPYIKGRKLLDIGCGGGDDIVIYEKLGADVYGIDVSEFMVETAKHLVSKPENVRLGDIESIDFEDEFFDVVVGRYSLNHLEDIDKGYEEIHRILKRKAPMTVVVPHPLRDFENQKKKFYGKKIVSHCIFNTNIRYPFHTFGDYFSQRFFELFTIEGFKEEKNSTKDKRVFVPEFMGIKASKK